MVMLLLKKQLEGVLEMSKTIVALDFSSKQEVIDFLKQNFGCNRKVYNLCVDSLYAQLEKAGYQAGDDIPQR